MNTGVGIRVNRPIQGGIRAAWLLTFTASALIFIAHTNQVHASDLDTPAYMIYVDPITGKYSARPPEGSTGATDISAGDPAQESNTSGTGMMTAQTTTTSTITAPIIAILLLTAVAFISLLVKGKQTS